MVRDHAVKEVSLYMETDGAIAMTAGARGPARRVAASAALLVAAGALAAVCGPAPSMAAAPLTGAQGCRAVALALTNGPDPDADPIGYALALVRPLRQIHTNDARLARAIDRLAGAYETFYKANGAGSAPKRGVSQAMRRVRTLCPRAGL